MSFCLFFLSGIVLQQALIVSTAALFVAAIFLLILSWFVRKSGALLFIFMVLTLVCGMLRFGIIQSEQTRLGDAVRQLDGLSVELVGRIRSTKRIDNGIRYVVQTSILKGDKVRLMEDIQVHLYSRKSKEYDIGDSIAAHGEFRLIRGPRNPGDFDFKSFYHRRNIWGNIFQRENSQLVVTKPVGSFGLTAVVEGVREWAKNLFDRTIGGDAGKLMSALVLGLREEIPTDIRQDFADTGVIHVLAVSGLHVGYVLVIFTALMKLIRVPYRWDKVAVILALMAYAVMTGGKASVWRATIMASLYLMARLLQREANLWNIIAAAALGLLIYNPNYLFGLGFLLSFTAVISIVFFYGQFERILPGRFRVSKIQNSFLKGATALFIVSLSAQIGTLPFAWSFFHRIPIISLLANVVIVPIIGIIVSTGFAIIFLGSWISYLGWAFGNTAWFLSKLIFWLTHLFSDVPFAYLHVNPPSFLNILQYVGIIATLFLIFQRNPRRKAVIALAFTANLFVWPWVFHRDTLDAIFMDVGQGDAAVVTIPTNKGRKTILVDAGMKGFRRDMGESVVLPVLEYLGVSRIDLLVMSHPHSDHIGGVETVLRKLPVRMVWDTFSGYKSELYQRILTQISGTSIPYRKVGSGNWIRDFGPLQIYTLHPDSLWAISEQNVNNTSLVLKLVYRDVSFLFVGDLEEEGNREVMEFGKYNHATVLKVGHHGSMTSTTQSFLDLVRPIIAVISVGQRNKFGLPSEEIIKRIEKSGATVYRTDLEGAIWLKSDGERIWNFSWR